MNLRRPFFIFIYILIHTFFNTDRAKGKIEKNLCARRNRN
jgi:hypothetical protein